MQKGINYQEITPLIKSFLEEDGFSFDVTSNFLFGDKDTCFARLIAKEDMLICGVLVAKKVFLVADKTTQFTPLVSDKDEVKCGTVIAEINGSAKAVMGAERVALNLLQRMSGVASVTKKFVQEVDRAKTKTKVLDTRKTAPGLRVFDRYSVACGGGTNHRYNLSDAVLIKDNHIKLAKFNGLNLKEVVMSCKGGVSNKGMAIEVEVSSPQMAIEAQKAGADVILLDNMPVTEVSEVQEKIGHLVTLEASGGISLDSVFGYAKTKVSRVSVGSLTHSVVAKDISLQVFNR